MFFQCVHVYVSAFSSSSYLNLPLAQLSLPLTMALLFSLILCLCVGSFAVAGGDIEEYIPDVSWLLESETRAQET
jgi:hypothetical protein